MADLRALVIAVSAFFSGVAHAGYAQLAPPTGWSPGSGLASGAGGAFNFPNAANSAQLVNGTVRTNASLNVGGRAVSIPATVRFAANAPRVASALIFMNPTLRLAASVAMWLGVGQIIWDIAEKKWKVKDDTVNTGRFEYRVNNIGVDTGWVGEFETACNKWASGLSGRPGYQSVVIIRYLPNDLVCHYRAVYNNSAFEDGIYVSRRDNPNAGAEAKWRPIGEEEFDEIIRRSPMPETMPRDLPEPLPIEFPQIQPTFIPTGNPVPNPNFDPSQQVGPGNQPWNQPGVRVVPAPVPGSPWQVDVQPVDRPVVSPDPDPNPKPDGEGNPDDKPKEKDPGLCEMYPDIVACQKLGNIDAKELPKKTVSMSIDKENIGPENGTCPAPRQFEIMGKQMAFQWDLLCDFANGIRPLLIGFAWLSAALAFVGLTRRGD
ncbi:IgG-binding virulence factor TspB family protein [Delftia sp. WSY_14]|uniref:IgG-binding virulence factor TspB family protein n=1 Tax=unclassified Delftia TaxID=2613839 RepID=UPI00370C008C